MFFPYQMRHLTSPQISFLVKMTRDFSMLFYKVTKSLQIEKYIIILGMLMRIVMLKVGY